MTQIYLDNASTSFPKAPGTGAAVADMLENHAYNVSRTGFDGAYDLLEEVADTRRLLSELFCAPSDSRVCFTAGATQALNQFLKGLLRPGDHIVVSSVEHNAVMRPLTSLAGQGVEFDCAQCASDGTLDPERIRELIRDNTKAVLVTHASNVCGTILPAAEIGKICGEKGIWFALDAAQTAGCVPIDMKTMQIDFLAFPGHKGLLGPQGVGGFVVRDALAREMTPLIEGGTGSRSDSENQPDFLPDKFESGTLPLPAIVGLRHALRETERAGSERGKTERELAARFLDEIGDIPGIRIAGIADPDDRRRIGVVSVDFTQTDNGAAAFELENRGIITRVGLHCAPRAHMTLGTYPQGTVRFSFGPYNTAEEVDAAARAVRETALQSLEYTNSDTKQNAAE